ncbi:MAG: amidohydrolase [Bacteroidota bacterium]
MHPLRITLVQAKLYWEDTLSNLNAFTEQLEPLAGQTDLVLLPEMFTTGFSMNATALAETMDGLTMQWLSEQAEKLEAIVTGSVIIKSNERYYNRLIWMRPDGTYDYYDKKHLFTMAEEHLTYTAGQAKKIIDYKGWKICPMICYDLRFPVWARNAEDYDLLFYVANWPVKRSFHWKSLLLARAIENQAFVVGVNRVGLDGKGFYYTGDSCIVSPIGEYLFQAADRVVLHTQSIDRADVIAAREKLPFLGDRDVFVIDKVN